MPFCCASHSAGIRLAADRIDQAELQRLPPGIGPPIGQLAHPRRVHVPAGRDHADELVVHVHDQPLQHVPALRRQRPGEAGLVLQRAGGDRLGARRRSTSAARTPRRSPAEHRSSRSACPRARRSARRAPRPCSRRTPPCRPSPQRPASSPATWAIASCRPSPPATLPPGLSIATISALTLSLSASFVTASIELAVVGDHPAHGQARKVRSAEWRIARRAAPPAPRPARRARQGSARRTGGA